MLVAVVRGSERSQESRSRLRFPSFDVPPFSCHRHPTSSHRSRWGSSEGWVTWQSSPLLALHSFISGYAFTRATNQLCCIDFAGVFFLFQ